ncbi:hypothetical protein CC78DRAFT_587140 [Lojkania enalia]|uniref:Uncharacterized protein n=1 Tax=Lojkania enalia TaxID=147567 RepID=A0A9P4JXR4_9PLEO|nr:hypothetical protein CC78DRAFT_587140 [Didymosphaeria enalia]
MTDCWETWMDDELTNSWASVWAGVERCRRFPQVAAGGLAPAHLAVLRPSAHASINEGCDTFIPTPEPVLFTDDSAPLSAVGEPLTGLDSWALSLRQGSRQHSSFGGIDRQTPRSVWAARPSYLATAMRVVSLRLVATRGDSWQESIIIADKNKVWHYSSS